MTGGAGEVNQMVNHAQRFRLGVTLFVLGLILALLEGNFWIQRGELPYALLTVLGIAVLLYGLRLLRYKRSV